MNLKKNFLWVGFFLFFQYNLLCQVHQYEFNEIWNYKVIGHSNNVEYYTISSNSSGNYMNLQGKYDSILVDFQQEKAYRISNKQILSKEDFKK